MFIYNILALAMYESLGISLSKTGSFIRLIPMATWEEVLFRLLPLFILVRKSATRKERILSFVVWFWITMGILSMLRINYILADWRFIAVLVFLSVFVWFLKSKIKLVLLVVIISSAVFGFTHGGWINLLFQGVGGVILSFCFLKCGGYNNNISKATISSTTSHFFYNAALLFLGYAY